MCQSKTSCCARCASACQTAQTGLLRYVVRSDVNILYHRATTDGVEDSGSVAAIACSSPRRRRWPTLLLCCTGSGMCPWMRCAYLVVSIWSTCAFVYRSSCQCQWKPSPAAQVLRFEGRRLLEPLSLCDVGLEGAQTNMVVVEVRCLQALGLLRFCTHI